MCTTLFYVLNKDAILKSRTGTTTRGAHQIEMGRTRTVTAALVALLALVVCGVAGDMATLKTRAVHDPVAATRGLIARRLGDKYNDQVGLVK